jgi:predicted nicotinamide N-methyase
LPGQFLKGLNGARLPLGALSLRLPGADVASTPPLSLVLPLDVDAVLDHYVDAGAGDADPYWARPWPSGAVLAATLIDNPSLVAARTVVDLGAGLGLAGLGAARAGAARVLITDRDPLALQCAAASAAASGVVVDVAALDWRDGDALAAARADVVLAADVLYERDAAAPVADALAALVAPGGTAIVADPAARAPAIRAAFADALAGRLVLESWRAVDGDSGAAVAVGGDGAPPPRGAVLLLTLVSPVWPAAHSVRAREWP